MDLFSTPTFNGKYLRPNSAKPIAGWCAVTAFKRPLVECKIASAYAVPGTPVYVTTADSASASNAGVGLNPNVQSADGLSVSAISGFLVVSPTDVQPTGEDAAYAIKNQISQVALLHSGAELYLPINAADLQSKDVVNTTLYWDSTNKYLTTTSSSNTEVPGLMIMSQVVDGVKIVKADADTAAVYEECSVVKVKLA